MVTLNFGRWDFHSDTFNGMRDTHLPQFDQGLSALIEDLHARGLDKDVAVVAWGEFGRTPKINTDAGRDHWPQVGGALLAGGGFRMGQVIGSTDRLGAEIASRPVHFGEVFATLRYNAAHQDSNRNFTFSSAPAPAFARVLVLTGSRSCSATELLINGLAPYAQVVTIGGTSCGKPYGFSPVASCENTFSVVNFRAVNGRGEADYDAGITPDCAQVDDFERALGDPAETLTAAALGYLRGGSCPVAASARAGALPSSARAGAMTARPPSSFVEPGDRRGMSAD